jgi:uncharacterized protein (DUF1697 family)
MARFVAFLRGVSPMNLSMADLKRCLESAGFTAVKTVLSSGNAAFTWSGKSTADVTKTIEAAMTKRLGRTFHTIVRRQDELVALVATDPFAGFRVPAGAKRVVTFSRTTLQPKQPLPVAQDTARILTAKGCEAFTAYVPSPQGPVFMKLIEATFGTDVTTRTWDTVKKCAKA